MALRKLVSSLWTILLGIVVFASLPVHASSSIPQFFNYQGRLLTSGGTNVTDGTYAIKFSLYDAATGGTPIWTASGTTGLPTALNVTVTNGLFSVLLGDASFQSQNSLSSLDWDQDGLYLGITVGSDSEMTPRKKLSSVPFALNAGQLQGQYASSSVASTGGSLFEVHQTTADSASAQRTALSIKTEGTNNSNDFLIVGKNDSSDVFTVSRQGSVTTTGNLASNGNVTLGDTTSDRVVFNAYVMSDVLPATDLAYRLGDSSHRWLGLDVGTVTTTNLYATTVSSTNGLFTNATSSWLGATTVSTTQLFVNGQAISSGVPATTATLQAITQNGATTTDLIYAFGGINASNLTATGTTSLQGTTMTSATATAVTSTNLFSTFGTITTLGSTYLTATQATATTLAFTSASGSSLLVAGQNVCLANGTNCQAMPSIPAGSYVWTDDPANNLVYNTTSTRSVRLGSQATTTVIAQMPSPNYVGNNAAGLMVFLDNNNVYWWGPYNTELRVEKLVGGVGTNDLSHVSITPSPVWLRVRIDQMRVAFDYSTDGSNYTNQWNQNLDFTPIGVGLFHKNFGGSNIIQSYDYLEVNGRMVDGFNDGSLGGDWVSYVPSGSITESSGSLNINNGGDWWAGVANAPYAYIPFSKLDAYVLAQFLYVPGTATSTVMIGSDVTTNLLVGTTTYGGGLNSNFQVNGNDVYAQGMIGSQEGLFSATGVTVGLGTTVYGDGNLYKTNAGDFTLALNNAASNWRFRTGSQESFTVASTGNVGIGVSTPLEALDVSGTIRNVLRSGQVFDTLSTISGITNPTNVRVQGGYAYVATAGGYLRVYDVSNPVSPAYLNQVSFGGNAYTARVSGRYAYVVNDSGSALKVIDISNPSSPVVSGSVTTNSAPRGLYVDGRYAYVANTTANSLQIVDISNPTNPVIIKTIASVSTGPKQVVKSGRYAYLVSITSNDFKVIDVADPSNAVVVGTVAVGSYPNDIAINGRYAYVANYSSDSVSIVDIANVAAPSVVGTISLLATDGPSDIMVSGRYLYVTNYDSGSIYIYDISNPTSPVQITKKTTGAATWGIDVVGGTAYVASYSAGTVTLIDLKGTETSALQAHSAELGSLSVLTSASIYNQMNVGGSLTVGPGGLLSQGSLAISSTNTTSTFVFAVSSTNMEVSNRLTVGGRTVCLENGTNCPAAAVIPGGAYAWSDDNASNTFYNTTSSRDVLIGGSTTATANFMIDKDGATSTVIVGGSTGNANLLVGTTTYGGGLNANFQVNGNDVYAQGMIGSQEGLFSATGVTVGLGTTVYGDGNLYKTNAGDFTLALNDAGSSFRISSGGRESVAVASSGNVGIGVSTPLEALDVSGTVSNLFRNAQPLTTVTSTLIGGSQAARVVVSGKYAYVTDKNGGTNPALRILDITNPRVPSLVGSLVIDVQPIAISVNGNYAYITHENGANYGFTVVDVSNPTAPYRVSRVNLGSSVWSQKILGNYAYLGTGVTNKRLIILDISNPASPVEVGSLNLGSDTVYGLDVQGRYAYVNMYGGGTMRVVDVANPAAPVQVGSVSFPNTGIYGVAVQGRYAYVGNGGNNLMYVVDISNPASPTLVKTVSTGMHGPWYLKVDGRYLYVANYNTGGSAEKLIVFDITSSTNPVMAAYSAAQGGATGLWDVAVSGRYAYTTEYAGTRLSVIDLEGVEVSALSAHSAELGSLSVLGDASIFNRLTLGGGLNIGPNGLLSQGALAISSTTTVSKFLFAVSSTNMEVSNALTVGGQSVCLQDGTNCVSGPSPWTESAASNTVITAAEGRNLALVTDKGTVTPPSSTYAAVVRVTNTGLVANNQLGLVLYRDRSNFYMWGPSNGGTLDLALAKVVNDTGASIYATTSKGLPVWLRIRYAAPTAYFDYSTDGVTFYNATSLTSEITPFAMGPFHKNWGGTNVTASFDDFSLNDFSDGFTGTNLGPAWSQYAGTGSINISGGTLNLVNGGDWWSGTAENAPHTLAYFANVAGVFVDAERGNVHFGYNTNTNLYVGTSTYGGGLNSAFTLNGNDIIAQGAIGSIEGMFSATGVRVGTGTTVYGDGNLYKTTAGDFTLALNDAGSSYRLYSGGQEAMTVASSGNIGIGVANPSEALDVEGGIDSSYGNTTFKMVYSKSPITQFGNCGGSIPESTKQGHFMYVICGNDLFIFDISDPLSPRYTGTAARPDAYSFVGVEVRGNLLYAAVSITSNGTTALEIWDVSNPSVPRWITTVNGGGTYFSTDSIELNGNYAYLGFTNGYYVFDIKNPYSPQWVRTITLSDRVNGFAFNDRYMYTVSYNRLLSVWGLSDPSNPNLLYSTTTGDASNVLDNITIYGKYAYIQQQNAGKILIFDITNPTYPKWLSTHSASSPSIVDVDGRYLYYYTSGDSINYALDVSNPYNPVIAGRGAPTSLYATRQISGRYMYAAGTYTNPYFFHVVDLRGSETSALSAGSAEIGQLRTDEMSVGGRLSVFNGLWASNGNISMDGAMVVMATGTTSTFYAYVSSTNGNFTDRLTVGGQRVCLESGGGCASGALAWTEDATSNILRPNNTGRDVLLGGSTSATAGFIFDKGVTTSTVIVVSGLNVGATAYSGGLNSAFATNGNDVFASGKIGSLEGLFSATGVRVGTGTTVYGDGNLYKTTAGDFNLALNNPASNWRFGIGGEDMFTVASSGRIIMADVPNPQTTLDFQGNIKSILRSGGGMDRVYASSTSVAGPVAIQGKYMYGSLNYGTFSITDISDPANPKRISNYYVANSTITDVKVQGNYAYLGVGGWGYFWVMDVSNPYNPVPVSQFSGGVNAYNIAISGKYAFVPDSDGVALDVIDVGNPRKARMAAAISTGGSWPNQISIDNGAAYVMDTNNLTLKSFDISHPESPVLLATTSTVGTPIEIVASGRYAYVLTNAQLRIIDVSNPSAMRLVKILSYGSGRSLTVNGRYAYVAGNGYIAAVDISDPVNAYQVFSTAFYSGTNVNGMSVNGKYLYVASDYSGTIRLTIFDIGGLETSALSAASAELGSLQVLQSAEIGGRLTVGGGMDVGYGGIFSLGSLAISSTNTTSTFVNAVSSTQGRFSDKVLADQNMKVGNGIVMHGNIENKPHTGQTFQIVYTTTTPEAVYGLDIQDNLLVEIGTNWTRVMDISQPTLPRILSIANTPNWGQDVKISGKYVYAFRYNSTYFHIFDVSNPSVMVQKSVYTLSNTAYSVAVQGNYLITAGENPGRLKIYDVYDPSSPVLLSSAVVGTNAQYVTVKGNYAYVASVDGAAFTIVDITDKRSPVVKSSTSVGGTRAVAVQGRYAYVSATDVVRVYNVSNPSSPSLVSSIDTGTATVQKMIVDGNILHVLCNNEYMQIDISNPAVLAKKGGVGVTNGYELAVKGRYAYVGSTSHYIYVIDIKGTETNGLAAQSAELGALSVETGMRAAGDFTVNSSLKAVSGILSGGALSVGATTTAANIYPFANNFYDLGSPDKSFRNVYASSTVYATDISLSSSTVYTISPGSPPVLASSINPGTGSTAPTHAAINGKYAYVANYGNDTFSTVDMSDPRYPVVKGTLALTAGYDPFKIAVSGDYAFVVNYTNASLYVINISRPTSPTLVRTVATPNSNNSGVAVYGKTMYVISRAGLNMRVFDISDPTNPKGIRTVSITGGTPYGIRVQGRYAYIAQNNGASVAGAMKIYDLSDPQNPALASSLTLTSNNGAYEIAVQGRYAYIPNWDSGTMSIIDVSNPSSPSVVKNLSVGTSAVGVEVSGRYAFVTLYSNNQMKVVDVASSTAAAVVATLTTSAGPLYPVVSGRYAFVPCYTGNRFDIFEIRGAETQALTAHSAEAGSLSVLTSASVYNQLSVGTNLTIGGSLETFGSLSVASTNTTSTFVYAVSSTYGEFSNRLTVGGQSVCLLNRVNCPDVIATSYWTDDPANNIIIPSSTARDIMFGGSTTATAGFIFDKGANTSTVIIGSYTGNANLMVGTTTYGGGLNSSFALNGNDILVQGRLGSLEGLYSATGVRVGTGTTVYGDGALWKTTNGDFNLNASLKESFENATFPPTSDWTTGGNASWVRTTATSTDGIASASSSKILDNQLEWLDYRFNSTMSGQVTFKWKVSSEANWDFLAVCIDQLDANCTRVGSGRYAYISGMVDWTSVTVPFSGAGSHKIRWIYAKDSSNGYYFDGGWIDDVRINSGWSFSAGGSERLRIDGNGNIGIGVTAPQSTLDINGNIDLTLHTTVNVPTLATLTVGTNPESFVVWGKYAAVSNYGGNNISIVDLSDPSKPAVVSTVVLNCPQGIDVNGRYMFVTNACSGSLNIYDISNPSSVSLVKSFTQPFLRGLKAVGKNVYTLAKTFVTAGKFAITDVSDPYFPFTSASTTTGEPSGTYAFLDVQGQYAYLALTTANRMEIWDVSNSSNPVLATSTITGTAPRAVKVQGGYAYLTTASSNYLQIYDISSSTYPVLVKSVTVGSGPHGLDVSGRYAYVANSSANTVSIVDISSSTAASVVKTVTVGSAPWEVKVSGKYMYVTNRTSNTLTIHDISGLETNALIAASAEFGNLNVRSNANVFNNFNIGGGLSVGQGGIYANGPLGVYATSTFVQSVMNTGSMLVGATGTNIGERLQVEGNILIRKRSSAVAEAWNATGTSYTNVPTVRSSHAAVWTGSKMVVWGGENSGGYLNTGAVYDPANDTWKTITTTNAPTARRGHTAVWTGSKMVVWGGYGAAGSVNTGGIYDPLTDSWKTITTTNAPTARYMHTAVWTGSKMVVWGGDDGTIGGCDTGSVYDPVTNAWTTMTTTNAPQARYSHGAIWMTPSGTSSKMFVWGGNGAGEGQSGGGMYDPANNSWTKTAASEPQPRASYGIVWTGSKVIIHGGYYSGVLNSGAIFDPVANSWTNITTTNAPTRTLYSAVWTGFRMIVWGGSTDGFATGVVNTGASYDPYANTWTSMTNTNAPVARFGQTAVWTGSRMVVWGGQGSSAYLNSGRIYTPSQYQGNIMAEGDGYIGGELQVVSDIHAGGFYSKSGSDFAEYMPVDASLAAPEAGDVVILSEGSGNRIAKSSASSRRFLVGAITNRPAVVGNADPAFKDDPGYALVSMLGQVDVKFSPKNGDIAPGDYLTAGDDGYAVKAKGPGPILGQALQAGDTTSSVLTYVNPQWWAGDLLSAEGDANFLKSDLAVSSKGIATSSTTAFGSSLFSFQGSAWDEASQSAVPTSFSMRNDTVSPTSSFFTLSFATGTDMQSPVLSISNLGDVSVTGDLTVGRRLFLGSKTNGTGSSSTYIYVDDTLAPSSTYIATNADGWQTSSTYDYAERYESGEKLNPGDLVTSDGSGVNKVKKATSSLEPILGIVSTKPGFITGGYLKDSYPIALAGRVPTRVSTQNGAILVGDYLTVSDLNPGLAVKAVQSGNIVGIALESFDQPGEGIISVFVKPGYQNILNGDTAPSSASSGVQSADSGTGTGSVRSGLAKIYAGMKEVKVTYESIGAYPIVNVRPYGKVAKHFWVIDATDRSFTIVVGEAPQSDVVFSWTVLPSQTGNAIYFSDETSIPYDPTTGLPIGPLPPASPITPPTNTETNSSTQP